MDKDSEIGQAYEALHIKVYGHVPKQGDIITVKVLHDAIKVIDQLENRLKVKRTSTMHFDRAGTEPLIGPDGH